MSFSIFYTLIIILITIKTFKFKIINTYNSITLIGGKSNMKKIYTIFILGLLLMGTIGAATYTPKTSMNFEKIQMNEALFKIDNLKVMKTSNNYVTLELDEVSTFISQPGKPHIPKIVKTIELPFGITNVNVQVTPSSTVTKTIEYEVKPASALIPLTVYEYEIKSKGSIKDEAVYSSTNAYPDTWGDYKVTCGINKNNEPISYVTIDIFPIQYYPLKDSLTITENVDIKLTYELPSDNPFPLNAEYDLVIIAPEVFSDALQPLVAHKISNGFNTYLKTTEEIYNEYSGTDKPEQIKYFIKDAKETQGITYVLLVGGLNNMINAKPRDDCNQGYSDWYLPVRYTNLYDDPAFPLASDFHDPGTMSDLYFADLYEEGGAFSSWDPNNDGIFAAWDKEGYQDDENLDFTPDVCLGRLACRSVEEVNTVVNKIMTYETGGTDPSWFRKMIVVSGDGFLDQTDLNMLWDTNAVETGEYTMYAQSFNPEGESGPIEEITFTVDHSQDTVLTFNHNDHLRVDGFPGPPIAEIVSVSDGDVLGKDDVMYTPGEGEAYCNEFYFWANLSYVDGILTIRGKSYDPKPYGNLSSIHVWIENSQGEEIFSEWREDLEMYYEGEWTTGELALKGRGGALYYLPEDFEKEIVWASNGQLTGPDDIIESVSKGCGFLFFSGHGSPNVWTDQYPGIPGNRAYGGIPGFQVTTLKPWPPFFDIPVFPMDTLSNGEKLPIAVVGGCHNSQFNVSMIRGVLDILPYFIPGFPELMMWCHGAPVPETFSWRMIRNPNGGAIASMGNTGLGYGMPGKDLTTGGGDSWITIEFFRQYGEEGHDILGQAYAQTLTNYVNTFDMTDLPAGHPKTIEQWVLLGDPTLKIGGYN